MKGNVHCQYCNFYSCFSVVWVTVVGGVLPSPKHFVLIIKKMNPLENHCFPTYLKKKNFR